MSLPASGWANKSGTTPRSCNCGSWKDHWIKFAKKPWPDSCSVSGCSSKPTLGAHIFNPAVTGERIAPMCDSCNKITVTFTLKGSITLPSANVSKTCG
jgi:hypothetical protein